MPKLDQLNSQAQLLLLQAQRVYLRRDESIAFAGISFDPNGPHLRFSPMKDVVWIELSPTTLQFPDQALYQIAHEVIHLLSPVLEPPANMLEEGLATHFSLYGPTFSSPIYRELALDHIEVDPAAKNYRDALHSYLALVRLDPRAILFLRSQRAHFGNMDADFIMSIMPQVPRELADRLSERRPMR